MNPTDQDQPLTWTEAFADLRVQLEMLTCKPDAVALIIRVPKGAHVDVRQIVINLSKASREISAKIPSGLPIIVLYDDVTLEFANADRMREAGWIRATPQSSSASSSP